MDITDPNNKSVKTVSESVHTQCWESQVMTHVGITRTDEVWWWCTEYDELITDIYKQLFAQLSISTLLRPWKISNHVTLLTVRDFDRTVTELFCPRFLYWPFYYYSTRIDELPKLQYLYSYTVGYCWNFERFNFTMLFKPSWLFNLVI